MNSNVAVSDYGINFKIFQNNCNIVVINCGITVHTLVWTLFSFLNYFSNFFFSRGSMDGVSSTLTSMEGVIPLSWSLILALRIKLSLSWR